MSVSVDVAVEKVNKNLQLSRPEIRLYLEYLRDLSFIEIKTIGGPLLYGHVRLTKTGLGKIEAIQKNRKGT